MLKSKKITLIFETSPATQNDRTDTSMSAEIKVCV